MKLTLKCLAPILLCTFAEPAHAEALSTTSVGMGIRTVTYTQAKQTGQTETQSSSNGTQVTENLNNPILCQRVSTPSSLGLELGAGGCVQGGGTQTFAYAISSHVQLIYYPLASRSRIDDDASIHVNRLFFGDLYVFGQGGFVKISHAEVAGTPRTLTTDALEFGGGIGWSYRLFDKMSLGLEGTYLVGSFLSKATTGTTNVIIASGLITVFL